MKQNKRILFAGGGTGGHVFPIANLIDEIHTDAALAYDLFWLGEKGGLEEKEAKRRSDVLFSFITSGKYRRTTTLVSYRNNAKDAFRILRGTIVSVCFIWKHTIDGVVSKGGYIALPVVLATYITRTPLLIHESDTKLGLTNRIGAKRAQGIYTAFPLVHEDATLIGQLLSNDMAQSSSEEEFEALLGCTKDNNMTYLLLMGGSQGATSLYDIVAELAKEKELLSSYHIIVIRGILNKTYSGFDSVANCTVIDFATQKELATLYKYCDIAITRAGTTSLAEQKLWDMKLCMVPLPRTHDQYSNAEYYVREYDDVLLPQDESLQRELKNFLIRHKGFHKKIVEKDRKKIVRRPKRQLLQKIFTL